MIKNTKNIFDKDTLKLIYYAHIHSHIAYRLNIWCGMVTKEVLNKIQKVQNYCMSIIQPNQNIKITAKKEKNTEYLLTYLWMQPTKIDNDLRQ